MSPRKEMRLYLGAFLFWYLFLINPQNSLVDGQEFWGLLFYFAIPSVFFFLVLKAYLQSSKKPLSGFDLILFFLVAFLGRVSSLLPPPLFENDFRRFVFDANLLLNSLNPYIISPEQYIQTGGPLSSMALQVDWGYLPTIYPPLAQAYFVLSQYLAPEALGFYLLNFFSELSIFFLGIFLFKKWQKRELWILCWGLSPLISKEIVNSLHYDHLPAILILTAIALRRRPTLAGACIGAASSLKLFPLIVVPLLWVQIKSRRKFLAGFFLALAIPQAALSFFLGTYPYLGSLDTFLQDWLWTAPFHMLLRTVFSKTLTQSLLLLIFALSYILIFLKLKRRSLHIQDGLLLALLIFLLSSSVIQPWYIVWLIPIGIYNQWKAFLLLHPFIFLSYLGFWENTQWSSINGTGLALQGLVWIYLIYDLKKSIAASKLPA